MIKGLLHLKKTNFKKMCRIPIWVIMTRKDIMQNSVTFFRQIQSLNTPLCTQPNFVTKSWPYRQNSKLYFLFTFDRACFKIGVFRLKVGEKSDTILHNIHPGPFDPCNKVLFKNCTHKWCASTFSRLQSIKNKSYTILLTLYGPANQLETSCFHLSLYVQ